MQRDLKQRHDVGLVIVDAARRDCDRGGGRVEQPHQRIVADQPTGIEEVGFAQFARLRECLKPDADRHARAIGHLGEGQS